MVTYLLIAIIVTLSLASLFWPSLANVVSGVGELSYPWQPWTAVFLYGWPGMPVLLHLAGNLILLMMVGPRVERRLGLRRFFCCDNFGDFYSGRRSPLLVGVEFNGASAFI